MGLYDNLKKALKGMLPQKDVRRVLAESGTKTVWYPRVHSWEPPRPVPQTDTIPHDTEMDRLTMGSEAASRAAYAFVGDKPDSGWVHDPRVGLWLRGKCGGNNIWRLCRLLNNPRRLKLLIVLYKACPDATNDALDVTTAGCVSNYSQSNVSLFLKQLCELGLFRRARSGNHTLYYPGSPDAAPEIAEIASQIRRRLMDGSYDTSYSAVFAPMMNDFRARVVHYIACGGDGCAENLSELLCKKRKFVLRDLSYALEGGLLDTTSEDGEGRYFYRPPADPIAQRIVELAR